MSSTVTLRRAVFGAILSGITALAIAEGSTAPTRVPVNYGDLDLSQPKDAATLYRRITHAARRACDQPERGDLRRITQYRSCYQTAVADAVNKVNAQTLSALHRNKTQSSAPG
jgi:UrcA family protein